MARCFLILLLPILLSLSLSLSLLADASSSLLLPLHNPEDNEVDDSVILQEDNKVDDSVILQDASKQNSILRLPSEKENEMEIEVPQLVRRPWGGLGLQIPKETHDQISVAPRLRQEESDFVSRPAEREVESNSPLKETESDSIFLRGGRKGWRFGHRGAGCHHHHGGEMKFGHRRGYGNHFRFRSQFPLSFFYTVHGDARPHGAEAVSSSLRKFPGEFQPRDQNEEPEFKPRERAFDRIGEGFPGRVHSRPWGHHLRFRPQFPRSSSFPSYGGPGKEAVSSSFRSFSAESLPGAENEELGKRVFERTGEIFPEREDSHGQWKWDLPNGEEQKDGRHEYPAAPWTDWLRSLFIRH